ncbi:MAG: hypothetical protein ACOX81_03285 [Candidatus Heteroscillospira sp.]|jgi:hypothetical protein
MSKKKKPPEKKPLVENRRVRAAIGRVMVFAVLALALLYLSGISVLTLIVGAKDVDTRGDMSKGAMQSLTGQVLGTFAANEKGTFAAVQCEDGVISVLLEEKPAVGEEITATGFVHLLGGELEQDLFAWYDKNGDFANGEKHFDNVSPMYIHDGYGRYFPIPASKLLICGGVVCAVYIILIYMGISSGKYGENK